MRNKLFSLCLIVALGLFSFVNSIFAVGTETSDSGLKLTYIPDGVRIVRWDRYAVGTGGAYVYNDSGSTTATAGEYDVTGYDLKSISIQVTNTDGGTVTIRPEYKIGSDTSFWVNQTVTNYSGTATGILVITDPIYKIRWGVIKTGTTTGQVTFCEEYKKTPRR
mgnify:FL=1